MQLSEVKVKIVGFRVTKETFHDIPEIHLGAAR